MINPLCVPKGVTKFYIALFGCLSFALQSIAQSTPISFPSSLKNASTEAQPLAIGDKVPDILFENILNYKNKKAKLSDFKGKLVILDIWSTWCTSCIAAFPKMESLQNEFKDKIQILLVNPHGIKYDSEEKIKTTLSKNKTRTGFYPTLPILINDTILNTYFPHQSVPHEVWINGNGKVIAITGSIDVTVENIQTILQGNQINIPVKNDWAFNSEKPLLLDGNGGSLNTFMYRSIFTGYIGGIGFNSGIRLNQNNEVIGLYILNRPLRQFISEAYSDVINGLSNNKIILDVMNPAQFNWVPDHDYIYCYDLTIPPIPWNQFVSSKYLREDLTRVFNIKVYKVKRKLKCLILTANESLINSFTKYDKTILDLDEKSIKKYIHNCPIGRIIKIFDHFETPIIDETNITQNIDIDFPKSFVMSDYSSVIKVLRNTGFKIREEEREFEVVMITDK